MSRGRQENIDCKIYVGDLNTHTSKQDVEDAFAYYGPIRSVWVARNPPGFAFVEYEDERDAEDAVKEVDGRRVINGRQVRVERAGNRRDRGRSRRGGGGSGPPVSRFSRRGGGRPFNPEDRCYECGDRGHYARDCARRKRGGPRSGKGKRSYSRSRSRSHSKNRSSRSRSRSYSRRRSYSKSPSRSPKRRSSPYQKKRSFDKKRTVSKSSDASSKSRTPVGTRKEKNNVVHD